MALYLGISSNGSIISADGYALKSIDDFVLFAQSSTSKLKIMMDGVAYHPNIELPRKEDE
jgi:hypothetical protein